MIEAAQLRSRAEEIDNRLCPIPGATADQIARELKQAADTIDDLLKAQQPSPQGGGDSTANPKKGDSHDQ